MKNNICDRTLAILMATYNGEKFINEQIDSLLGQTSQDWHLYVHDDGSTDGTVAIVKSYVNKCPDRITLLNYPPQGGACQNFLSMLDKVDASYYMFCDQDDVWLPEKIERQMAQMKLTESQHTGKAVMVYTDLTVVDQQLNMIYPSFWAYTGVQPAFLHTFEECGASLFVTGCTMLFNHQAKRSVVLPAEAATMHDAWITLCVAKAGGIIVDMHCQTVLYRQHGGNALGAQDATQNAWKKKILHLQRTLRSRRQHYKMLQALGYGSVWKHIWYKLIYRLRILKVKS